MDINEGFCPGYKKDKKQKNKNKKNQISGVFKNHKK